VTADLDLLVLGDANPDLVLRGGDVVPAFGQAERLIDAATLTVGGSGAILACGAAKLGLRVAISAVVGDDLFGRYMREALTDANVDTTGLVVDATAQTGITVVLSGLDDRAILTMPGTIAALTAERIDPSLLTRARHVHVSSYYLQTALRPSLPRILDEAHRAGATTSLDPNWDPSGSWDGGLLDLLPKVDVFLPNAMEATRSAHTSDLEAAARQLSTRATLVVVKNGDRGAVAGEGDRLHTIAGTLIQVIDTTGAGDSFDAGFLAAWLRREPIDRALAIANLCGALSTRAMGGVDAQPTMDEVLAVLDEGSAA
jgi:sugar/nucleoside kinase (ribokinase family)